MVITARFVLPDDAILQPASQLTQSLRTLIQADEADFVLSRPSSRSLAKVMDQEAARLIRHFEKPSTIAQAVARYSFGDASTANQLLESAFPLFQSLILEGLLVEAGTTESQTIQPSLALGEDVDGWIVVRCIQALEDSEVYQVQGDSRQMAALKICRQGNRTVAAALAWEAEVLQSANLAVTSAVLGQGVWNERPWLALEWIAGADADHACGEIRASNKSGVRASLLRITGSILQAYAALHQRGIIHGDVHPRNIIVTPPDTARIIDFGLAGKFQEQCLVDRGVRGGISSFFEPEFARAFLAGSPSPAATFAGEQYALAAVLYLLLTGHHYVDFALEKRQMLRQIADTPLRPFAAHGLEPWPVVESLLERALNKDPAARFPSVRAFADAWQTVVVPSSLLDAEATPLISLRSSIMAQIVGTESAQTWASLPAPTTSLNYGSAGIAYALYRMSCAAGDPELLAWADVWITRAKKDQASANAYHSKELDITPETVGNSSLYHGAAGVHLVEALIAQARGDVSLQCAATEAFMKQSQDPCPEMDLVLGRAGILLSCGFLLDALRSQQATALLVNGENKLRQFGDVIVGQMWRTIDDRAAIQKITTISNLGMSHGWAGLLYATLCWSAATGGKPPQNLQDRLTQLAACAQPVGNGYRWKWDHNGAGIYVPGWCNGSAGYVFLWTAAHAAFKEPLYLRLAEGAAWNTWNTRSAEPSLCCGAAGQAYALMNLYRHTGEAAWLARARQRAHEAAEIAAHSSAINQSEDRPLSLYKSNLGIALLGLDVEFPDQARMPAFERD